MVAGAGLEAHHTLGERSRLPGGRVGEGAIEEGCKGCFCNGFRLAAATIDFTIGAVPGALESGQLALDAGEEFGRGPVGEEGGGEIGRASCRERVYACV